MALDTPARKNTSLIARNAIKIVIVGSLLALWGGIWNVYLFNHPPTYTIWQYLAFGFFATGVVMLVVGAMAGHIARSARVAEDPEEGTAS
jgi:hypothetical protein